MAEYTQNYNLEKQQGNEYISIDGLNENFDTIDTEIKKVNDNKVEKESGKELSSNDYTSTDKSKLAGIAENANNYVHPATHPASIITGLPTALPANGGNADTVDGLHASSFAQLGYAPADINNAISAGMYRLSTSHTNTPAELGCDYSQLLVIRGAGDTLTQMLGEFNTCNLFIRKAYGIGGSSPTFTAWSKITGMSSALYKSSNLLGIDGTVRVIARDDTTTFNNAAFGYPYVSSISNGSSIGLPNGWFHLMYFRHFDGNGYGAQLAIGLDTGNIMLIRTSIGTTWNPWRPVTPQYGTNDLAAGSSALATGSIYYVYE